MSRGRSPPQRWPPWRPSRTGARGPARCRGWPSRQSTPGSVPRDSGSTRPPRSPGVADAATGVAAVFVGTMPSRAQAPAMMARSPPRTRAPSGASATLPAREPPGVGVRGGRVPGWRGSRWRGSRWRGRCPGRWGTSPHPGAGHPGGGRSFASGSRCRAPAPRPRHPGREGHGERPQGDQRSPANHPDDADPLPGVADPDRPRGPRGHGETIRPAESLAVGEPLHPGAGLPSRAVGLAEHDRAGRGGQRNLAGGGPTDGRARAALAAVKCPIAPAGRPPGHRCRSTPRLQRRRRQGGYGRGTSRFA